VQNGTRVGDGSVTSGLSVGWDRSGRSTCPRSFRGCRAVRGRDGRGAGRLCRHLPRCRRRRQRRRRRVIPVAVVALAFLRIVGEALDDILRGRVARFHAVDPDLGTRRGSRPSTRTMKPSSVRPTPAPLVDVVDLDDDFLAGLDRLLFSARRWACRSGYTTPRRPCCRSVGTPFPRFVRRSWGNRRRVDSPPYRRRDRPPLKRFRLGGR